MKRQPCTFRQSDVTRAIKAAIAAGAKIARIEIDKSGKIILVADSPRLPESKDDAENEWKTE